MTSGRHQGQDEASGRLAIELARYALGLVDEPTPPTGRRGSPRAAQARQVAMYLCHVALGMSLSRVGAAFARDRSTVAHACHAMEERRDDPDFDDWIGDLEEALRMAPPPRIVDINVGGPEWMK